MQIQSMKAAILVETGQPLEVAEIRLPDRLRFGQVLVELHYSGICGSQIGEIEAAKGPDQWLPHLLGHEGSAKVLEVGEGVTTVAPGDKVVMHWRPGAGLQSPTPRYDWDGRTVNAGWVTTFNEFAVVSEDRLTVIPDDFDVKIASLLGCAVTTAIGVVNNDARLKVGQSIVVFGVGGVGVNLVHSAAMVSAYPIVAVDLFDNKLDMAKRLGATACINAANEEDVDAAIRAIVGSEGADVVVDTTGRARVIEQAYALTRADGKTILVGVPARDDNISIDSLPLHFNKVLTGSHGGSAAPHIEIPRYVRLMSAGKMSLDGIITHEFRLEQINTAIALLRRGETGRIVIDYT